MNLEEYARYDGLGLAELVRKREVSARELCALAIEGVASVNPRLNAVIETFPERLPAAGDVPPAPFAGVPFLVKDFPIEKGVRGEMGSRLAAGFAPDRDSEIMRRFHSAGLINLGRTAASELGLAALTASVHSGVTRNPWDPRRSTAGSSGGAAAAVAAGIVPIAQGGDGGGSIRTPAAFCGVVGLKPTRGRISLAPDEGYPYSGMTVVFALTRSVRDCAALLDAVAGPAAGDPFEIPPPERPWLQEVGRPPGPLRVAFTAKPWSGLPIDPEIARATAAAAAACERLGLAVTEAAPAFDYAAFLEAQIDLWCAHTAATIDAVAHALGRAPSDSNLQTTTWAVYRAGKDMPATKFLAAEAVYNDIARRVAGFFRQHDILLTPTSTVLPLPLDTHDLNAPGAGVRDLFDHLAPIEAFTALFNCTGQPALSLPLHWSQSGLPIGVQLAARPGAEATLFRLAAALEQALPWRHRRPPVHVAG
jgi:amidase